MSGRVCTLHRHARAARRTKHEPLSRRSEIVAEQLPARQQRDADERTRRVKIRFRHCINEMSERLPLADEGALREARSVALFLPIEANAERVWLDESPLVNVRDVLAANFAL